MWKALRHIIGHTRYKIPTLINAESFNDYFAKVGNNLAERLDDTTHVLHLPKSIHTFDLQPIEPSFVARQLQILQDVKFRHS